MGNWPVVLIVTIVVLAFRWQGDSWPAVVGKLVGLVALCLVVVVILGVAIARLS